MDKFSFNRCDESVLLRLLNLPELLADNVLLDRLAADGSVSGDDHADIALLVAAAEAYLSSAVYARTSFFAAAGRGRPKSTHESVVTVDCRLGGEKYRLAVQRISPNKYRFEVEGKVRTTSLRSTTSSTGSVGAMWERSARRHPRSSSQSTSSRAIWSPRATRWSCLRR